MPSVLHNVNEMLSTNKSAPKHPGSKSGVPQQGSEEQTFNILPHPAKSNDPADLQKPGEKTGGLRSGQGLFDAFTSTPGPVMPNQETLNNLGPAKSREELDALQAQLNKKS